MLWRSVKKPLTTLLQQTAYHQHLSRLLERWRPQGITPRRYALLCANARCLALHPERCTSEHGARLMRQRMAKAAHRIIRAQGRVLGAEGRKVANENARARKAQRQRDDRLGRWGRVGQANVDGI